MLHRSPLLSIDPARLGAKGEGDLLTKASHADLQIKADGAEGVIMGYGSVWDAVDSYGETVVKGAFKNSLNAWKKRGKPIPMLWQHRSDQPIGGWTVYREDEKGLYLEGKVNLETQRGQEAWSDVKAEIVTGLSIGYYELQAESWTRPANEPRKLIELDLRETSPVTFPALREAQIDAVKAKISRHEPLTLREFESVLREKLGHSRSEAEEIAALGYKAWIQREVGPEANAGDAVEALREIRSSLPPLALPVL